MTTRGTTLRLGTRSSDLATRQAGTVRDWLEQRRLTVELEEVETAGDQLRDELIHELGTTGAFVRALDEEVIDGDLDAAVHSMKDVPTDQPPELVIAGIPERAAPGDVLVTPGGTPLTELPRGATVGTSSLRRGAQLHSLRPDLTIEPLRGNVDTRVEKLLAPTLQREHAIRVDAEEADGEEAEDLPEFDRTVEEWFNDLAEIERRALEREVETDYDAICLAEAGLDRSGLLHHVEYERLDPAKFVPAPGQGTLAVTALDDEVAETINDVIDHPPTRVETTVERTILAELGGGCVAPVGIFARLQGEVVTTAVRVLAQDGTEEVSGTRDLPVQDHAKAAREFAADLAADGAADLIQQAKRETDE
jgi:hydroxymethylbilane synthase